MNVADWILVLFIAGIDVNGGSSQLKIEGLSEAQCRTAAEDFKKAGLASADAARQSYGKMHLLKGQLFGAICIERGKK